MKRKIILLGGGGHCKVIIDAIESSESFDIYGVLDPVLSKGSSVLGVHVIGADSALPEIYRKRIRCAFISVGSIGNCGPRKRIYAALKEIGFGLPVIVHPKAVVAKDAVIGEGSFIAAGAIINPAVRIGGNVIVNTNSSVDHDCQVGDFVHIAPGVALSGGVKVGDETHLGIGASVLQNITIGKRCMVRAGTILRHDVPDGKKV